jgi:hypothetical protein
MNELLAALTPDTITQLAWLVGAFVIGGTSLVGLFWLADSFDRWF